MTKSIQLLLLSLVAIPLVTMGGCKQNKNPLSTVIQTEIIRSDYAVGEITSLCKSATDTAKAEIDALVGAKISPKQALVQFEESMAGLGDKAYPLTFMGYVSTDGDLRTEGSQCEEALGQFVISIYTRKDIYDVLKKVDVGTLNPSLKRLASETILGFEKNGLKLPEATLDKVRQLKQQLTSLEAQFSKNLNEDVSSVAFSEQELLGVSAEFLARLKRDEQGRYIVTTKSTDYLQVMENAKDPMTRKRILFAYTNRAGVANTKLLEDAIVLRQQVATLMGYKTWADYRTDGRMAQNGDTVLTLLNSLKGKLAERNKSDLAILLKSKQELEEPNATEIKAWDVSYFANQVKKTQYNLDDDKIREYFPKDVVMKGLFEVYSQLLGVYFEEVKDAVVWTPEVKMYAIREKSNSDIVAYFYTDLVPREGKYGHAAEFPLISGRVLKEGYYSQPVASIVANFNPPANGKPSLLSHDEVETLFHEFGHVMHATMTKAPYASQSGTNTAQDFVEAPSQMLENWVWNAEILNKISGHYTDPTQKLPPELLKQMLAAKDFNLGYFYTRQLTLGLTDMAYHTASGPVDVTKVYDQVYKDTLGIEPLEGNHYVAGFGHLMGGYDAGYYGYIWSEVYAADMFSLFAEEGLLSEKLGLRYRRAILEQGNMKNALDMVREFLGREPNNEAFYKKLGISNGTLGVD